MCAGDAQTHSNKATATAACLVFGAFGECSQSADLVVGSFGKLIGEQGNAGIGHRTPGGRGGDGDVGAQTG